ncbi:GntR family transcriptional regulator [Acuticoccus mangrovi]|uniref:GntR family transcriptional regulator n=1 Tax=Acuticoccus mangrovi TaxID=2796142 RepID=A0A934INV6_9HYPH|nr:GntR family transcriptional regulator [Acuticoccus mangrovi]MBJ3776030.1 GntR family transcriptional regulator [Acuticoccus mangrovi]
MAASKESADVRSVSSSQRAYDELRELLMRFALLPNQKINEVMLAAQLHTSRTPLREALNRLVAEGLLNNQGRGFSVPDLKPEVVRDLFEARLEIECSTARLACERASDEDLKALSDFLTESASESPNVSVDRLIELDIRFHDTIARLSQNQVLRSLLSNLNDRIHLIRWIAMEGRRDNTQAQHRKILERIEARDKEGAAAAMRRHIIHRNDDILAAIKAAYGHVYTLSAV